MISQELEGKIKAQRENCCGLCRHREPLEFFIQLYKDASSKVWERCSSNKSNEEECVRGCIEHNGRWLRECSTHQKRMGGDYLKTRAVLLKNADISLDDLCKHAEEGEIGLKDLRFHHIYERIWDICATEVKEEKDGKDNKGFKEVCTFDTALRYVFLLSRDENGIINESLKNQLLPQDEVYLHQGSLKGAQILWNIDALMRNHHKRGLKPLDGRSDKIPFPFKVGKIKLCCFCGQLKELGAVQLEDFLCVFHNILRGYYLDLAEELSR